MNTSKEFCIGEFYQHENHLCYHFRASHSSLLVCTQHEIFVDHLLWVFQDHLQIACCHAKKSRPDASEFQCCKTDRTNNAAANAQARTHYRSLVAIKWKPGLEWKATQDCSDQFAVDSPSVVLLLICDFLVLGLKPLQAQPEVLESAGATGKVKAQQRRMTDLQNNRVHIANMLFLHMTIASFWHRTEAVSRPIWLSIFWRMLLEAAMVYSIGAWNLETHLGTWIPQRLDAETAPGTPESRPSSSLGFYEVSKMLENKQHGEETRQVQGKKAFDLWFAKLWRANAKASVRAWNIEFLQAALIYLQRRLRQCLPTCHICVCLPLPCWELPLDWKQCKVSK